MNISKSLLIGIGTIIIGLMAVFITLVTYATTDAHCANQKAQKASIKTSELDHRLQNYTILSSIQLKNINEKLEIIRKDVCEIKAKQENIRITIAQLPNNG